MKKFFQKIGAWFSRHKPSKRKLIQLYAALLYNANIKGFLKGRIYTGNSKYMCVPGLNCYSCPGAVGACPLGSLQNALASSNTRAPFYVFGIIILFGLLLGRTICGFLCPVGLFQELVYKIKTPKLKKNKFTRIASYLKYVILVAFVVVIPLAYAGHLAVPGFCKYICPAGTLGGAVSLLLHPNNEGMFAMLGPLFTWKFAVLCALVVASVFIFRFFCRFICPLGAIYGFFNKIALLGVRLDKNKCTDCGLCITHCKMDVSRVGDHECINCGECIDVCPAKAISFKGSKLFVHDNASAIPTAGEDVRPLGALLGSSAQTESVPEVENVVIAETAVAPKKRRGRGFWLRVACWGTALAVLVGALVYFNFIEKSPDNVDSLINQTCPEFTFESYEGEDFTISSAKGKILVLNFWYTTCGPCVAELPEFEEIAFEYQESLSVVAIHSYAFAQFENVEGFIQEKGWGEWNILFVKDNQEPAYTALGGKESYPMTVILDEEGIIRFQKEGKTSYDELKNVVEDLLKN